MAGYIGSGASVVSSGAENKKVFDITTNTTSLTGLNYTVGKVHVYHNGVRLVDGTDYTATNSTSITLTVAAVSGDQVVVVSYASFQLSEHYTKAETDILIAGADSTPSIDDNGNATALTIDGNENVLIGKTAQSVDTVGAEILPSGIGQFTVDGNFAGRFTRKTSDGDILVFRKGTGTVGSIGTSGNQSYIHGAGTDVGLFWGSNNVYPYRSSGLSDNTIDIGQASYRFKDAYLSGGVYLGGTGSANYLDDVETGTFTAGVSTGTIGGGDGTYVKVGDLVYCGITIGNFSNTSSGNAIVFTGLPFASNSANQGSNGSVFCRYVSGGFPDAAQVNTSATTGRMWKSGSTAFATVNHNDITNGGYAYFFISLTYRAA